MLLQCKGRLKIFLSNDIISRAAIKQVNCHARRAKISNYPLSLSDLWLKSELLESQREGPRHPLVVESCWQVLQYEGFSSLGA